MVLDMLRTHFTIGAVAIAMAICTAAARPVDAQVAAAPAPIQTSAPSIEEPSNSLAASPPSSVIYSATESDYILGPGDTLGVRVLPQDRYSVDAVPITQDGGLYYPKIGNIASIPTSPSL
jgi:protein involved in polysaccharide export with SLBB domain